MFPSGFLLKNRTIRKDNDPESKSFRREALSVLSLHASVRQPAYVTATSLLRLSLVKWNYNRMVRRR
jgi:hypothetical protein